MTRDEAVALARAVDRAPGWRADLPQPAGGAWQVIATHVISGQRYPLAHAAAWDALRLRERDALQAVMAEEKRVDRAAHLERVRPPASIIATQVEARRLIDLAQERARRNTSETTTTPQREDTMDTRTSTSTPAAALTRETWLALTDRAVTQARAEAQRRREALSAELAAIDALEEDARRLEAAAALVRGEVPAAVAHTARGRAAKKAPNGEPKKRLDIWLAQQPPGSVFFGPDVVRQTGVRDGAYYEWVAMAHRSGRLVRLQPGRYQVPGGPAPAATTPAQEPADAR